MMFHLILNLWSKTNPSEQRQPRTMQNYFLPWLSLALADTVVAHILFPFPNGATYEMCDMLDGSVGVFIRLIAHKNLSELWGAHLLFFVVWILATTWLMFLLARWICRRFLKNFGRKPQTIYVVEAVLCVLYWNM